MSCAFFVFFVSLEQGACTMFGGERPSPTLGQELEVG
jgi:hypothetical protein